MSDLEEVVVRHAKIGVEDLQESMKDVWDLLSRKQKASVERTARRVIELEIQQRAGKDVAEDLAFVRETFEGYKFSAKVAVQTAFVTAFWKGMDKAVEALGCFLAGIGRGLIYDWGRSFD